MKQLQTPNGDLIIGILDVVPGNCLVDGFEIDDKGKPDPVYAGETKMWWDEQKPVTQIADLSNMPWSNVPNSGFGYICRTKDDPIYLDDEGNEFRLKDLTVIDGE